MYVLLVGKKLSPKTLFLWEHDSIESGLHMCTREEEEEEEEASDGIKVFKTSGLWCERRIASSDFFRSHGSRLSAALTAALLLSR